MKTHGSGPAGFTLLEILVAATVAVLVAAGALAVVSNALAWNERVSGRQQARAEARRVLERVTVDLTGLCRGDGPGGGLVVTIADNPGISTLWENAANAQPGGLVAVQGEEIAAMRFGIGGVWLRFAAQVKGSDADGASQPRVVAYQVIRRQAPGAILPRYWLHRAVVRAGTQDGRLGTWETGWDLDPAGPGSFAQPAAGNDGTAAGDPYGVLRPEAAENLFAENVVDFGVRFLERTEEGIWRVLFPAGPDDRDYVAPKADRYPQAADLLVRVLTPEGARRLAAFETRREEGTDWWHVVAANSEVLTRRIQLPGGTR